MAYRQVAAVILYNERNEILLQKKDLTFPRWPGCWCMFGGGVEGNEDPETALKREIKEERDYDLGEITLLK